MNSTTKVLPALILILSTFLVNAQLNFPIKGIYDGEIGTDKLILIAEQSDSAITKGIFVKNRGKAVEETHVFSLLTSSAKPIFQSDLYVGKMKTSKFTPDSLS